MTIVKRKIELLAPGGDIDAIKAAILAGANAIYCGLDKFNARNRAANISFDDLQGILRLAHQHDCEIFITLNIIIVENEIPALINLLNKLVNTGVDGVIVQDLGMLYLLSKYYKGLNVHASTQMTTHNEGQIKFLSELNATRVNLSRELNIHEIKALSTLGHQHNILTEVFVHGSNCISFSGLCYISSVHGGNSGNRGRCSQPCRDRYITTAAGKDYPLNLKDNSAWFDLKELYEAGVYSLKIEGRIKKYDYVYTVVNSWKKHIQSLYHQNKPSVNNSLLYKVFNRDFSNTFLKGDISKEMFIDNPRDHSIKHLSEINHYASAEKLEEAQLELYREKDEIKSLVEAKISEVSTDKAPMIIKLSGECGEPLKVSVKTPDHTFDLLSEVNLVKKGTESLDHEMILKRFKALNDTAYKIEELNLDHLNPDLFIPFKELTSIKKRLLFILNDSKETVEPITVPVLKKHNDEEIKPTLSVLISSSDDIILCENRDAAFYYQLPNSFKDNCVDLIDLFRKNDKLIPWFPAVIIGEDYKAAVEFLEKLQPKLIVSNNTGIAYEAKKRNIDWIAGPYMNTANSYSLLCLKEKLNCSGAFISNELNKNQIKQIKCPEDFKLHYSLYHPIILMTSRQCLFQQVIGCEKNKLDDSCIQNCEKSTSITNLKKDAFFIEKTRGNYHTIYSETNFLNTDIPTDLPNTFSSYFIDLRHIKTGNKIEKDKSSLIKLFENCISGNTDSEKELKQIIHPSTKTQYKKGI